MLVFQRIRSNGITRPRSFVHSLSIKHSEISSDYPVGLSSLFEVLSPPTRIDSVCRRWFVRNAVYKHVFFGVSRRLEGRGPDLLYHDATMPLRGWNWLTRVAAIVSAKHLLEIQTANRNAEKGIAGGMLAAGRNAVARGKQERVKGAGSNIEIVWKDGHNRETRVGFVRYAILQQLHRLDTSFFFPSFFSAFYGSSFLGSNPERLL